MPDTFLSFWQNLPSQIDPVAFSLGGLAVRWYSLAYLAALATVYFLLRRRIKKEATTPLSISELESWLATLFFGALLGGRIGYGLLYDPAGFLSHPLAYFWPFSDGHFVGIFGMSFHGGLLGAALAGWIFSRKKDKSWQKLVNWMIPAVPLGYFWGRIGNFLGGELFGQSTNLPWGMRFPSAEDMSLRHPSQLYEATLEGLLPFFILWPLRNHRRFQRFLLPLYLALYGSARFAVEFLRQSDAGVIPILTMSRGQFYCLLMILSAGVIAAMEFSKQSSRKN